MTTTALILLIELGIMIALVVAIVAVGNWWLGPEEEIK